MKKLITLVASLFGRRFIDSSSLRSGKSVFSCRYNQNIYLQ